MWVHKEMLTEQLKGELTIVSTGELKMNNEKGGNSIKIYFSNK